MSAEAVVALAVLAALYVIQATLKRALFALFAVVLLVPDILIVPNGFSSYLSVHRVVLVAFLVNLIFRWSRGELPSHAFRPTPIHVAFAGFVIVAFVNGVMIAPGLLATAESLQGWVSLIDQLVFFSVVLVCVRAIADPWWVARALCVVLVAVCVIAVAEHFTSWSWSRWFFEYERSQGRFVDPARRLELRAGEVRVRVAAQFALAFGWIVAMLFPVLLAVTARARRWVIPGIAGTMLAMAAIFWSFARSAVVAAAASLLILWLLSRGDRSVGKLALGAAAIAGVVYMTSPTLLDPFSNPETRGSTQVRIERLPVVFDLVAQRPGTGLGLAGLDVFDVPTTDSSYLLIYGELGATGSAAFVVLLVTTIALVLPSLRGPPRTRTLGAGALTGLILAVFAAASFDLYSIPAAAFVFWILAGIGTTLAEAAPARERATRPARRRARRWALVPAAALFGVVVLAMVPASASATHRFEPFPGSREARARAPQTTKLSTLVLTTCDMAVALVTSEPGARARCRNLRTGLGEIRIEAQNAEAVRRTERRIFATARRYMPAFGVATIRPVETARPSWARTAWIWAPLAAALAILASAARASRST